MRTLSVFVVLLAIAALAYGSIFKSFEHTKEAKPVRAIKPKAARNTRNYGELFFNATFTYEDEIMPVYFRGENLPSVAYNLAFPEGDEGNYYMDLSFCGYFVEEGEWMDFFYEEVGEGEFFSLTIPEYYPLSYFSEFAYCVYLEDDTDYYLAVDHDNYINIDYQVFVHDGLEAGVGYYLEGEEVDITFTLTNGTVMELGFLIADEDFDLFGEFEEEPTIYYESDVFELDENNQFVVPLNTTGMDVGTYQILFAQLADLEMGEQHVWTVFFEVDITKEFTITQHLIVSDEDRDYLVLGEDHLEIHYEIEGNVRPLFLSNDGEILDSNDDEVNQVVSASLDELTTPGVYHLRLGSTYDDDLGLYGFFSVEVDNEVKTLTFTTEFEDEYVAEGEIVLEWETTGHITNVELSVHDEDGNLMTSSQIPNFGSVELPMSEAIAGKYIISIHDPNHPEVKAESPLVTVVEPKSDSSSASSVALTFVAALVAVVALFF